MKRRRFLQLAPLSAAVVGWSSPQVARSSADLNVLDFGADPTGTRDSATAIQKAADAALSDIGFDAKTRRAKASVHIPAGRYRVDKTLRFTGAPWRGDGMHLTELDFRGSGVAIDALSTDADRRRLTIADLQITGTRAARGAMGIRLGHNHRSFGAIQRVRISSFPSWGLYWAANCWKLSFYDLYVDACGAEKAGAIGHAAAVSDLNGIAWYNLQIENCGATANATAGGINLPTANVARAWSFFGGVWEGNRGVADALFTGVQAVSLNGVYVECSVSSRNALAKDGLVFDGGAFSMSGCWIQADQNHTGAGVKLLGACAGSIAGSALDGDDFAGGAASIADSSRLNVDGSVPRPSVKMKGAAVLTGAA